MAAITNPCHVSWYLQSGDECYCGDKEVRVYDWSNECDEVCSGESTEICGGDWRMSVFRKCMKKVNALQT